jgi:hypothetical protein
MAVVVWTPWHDLGTKRSSLSRPDVELDLKPTVLFSLTDSPQPSDGMWSSKACPLCLEIALCTCLPKAQTWRSFAVLAALKGETLKNLASQVLETQSSSGDVIWHLSCTVNLCANPSPRR